MPHGSPHFTVESASGNSASLLSAAGTVTAASLTTASLTTGATPAMASSAGVMPDAGALATPASLNGSHGVKAPHVHLGNGRQANGTVAEPRPATQPLPSANGTTSNGSSPGDGTQKSSTSQDAGKAFKFTNRTQTLLGIQIVGTGSYVPDNVITNADMEQKYGFQPGWIEQRTGILCRRHAPPGMNTSDMCVEAAQKAMRAARVSAADIDLVVVGTFTPDYPIPSTACLVQDRLGLDAPAIELQAACSGFVYSLITGAQYVATGNSKLALVIGADINSRVVNPYDQKTAPLFGDAAGAVLLARGEPHQGLLCYQIGADGSGAPLLNRPMGGTRAPLTAADIEAGRQYIHMEGRSVFKWAVRALTDTIELLLNKTGMSIHDVALFLLHQANQRIIAYAMEQLGIPSEKVFNNLDKYGNTSAGSIPLAMDEAFREGKIRRGDTLCLCGFGAGLSWGTALFRW